MYSIVKVGVHCCPSLRVLSISYCVLVVPCMNIVARLACTAVHLLNKRFVRRLLKRVNFPTRTLIINYDNVLHGNVIPLHPYLYKCFSLVVFSGTPSANSTRLIPVGPALSCIFIFMVFISPTFVPITGDSVRWYCGQDLSQIRGSIAIVYSLMFISWSTPSFAYDSIVNCQLCVI